MYEHLESRWWICIHPITMRFIKIKKKIFLLSMLEISGSQRTKMYALVLWDYSGLYIYHTFYTEPCSFTDWEKIEKKYFSIALPNYVMLIISIQFRVVFKYNFNIKNRGNKGGWNSTTGSCCVRVYSYDIFFCYRFKVLWKQGSITD